VFITAYKNFSIKQIKNVIHIFIKISFYQLNECLTHIIFQNKDEELFSTF